MRSEGTLEVIERTLQGQIIAKFVFDDDMRTLYQLKELQGKKAVISAEQWHDKRSNQANRYLWVLCDKIAKAINSTKDIVYELMLQDAGVFVDYEIPRDALDVFAKNWRMVQELYSFETESREAQVVDAELVYRSPTEMVGIRCWRGSHTYDKKEMGHLLNEVIYQAKDLGIETATPDELAHMVSMWEARNE